MELYEVIEIIHQRAGLSKNELEISSDGINLQCALKMAYYTSHIEFPIPQNDGDVNYITGQLSLENKKQKIAKKHYDISSI